jgi:hypothetical protein
LLEDACNPLGKTRTTSAIESKVAEGLGLDRRGEQPLEDVGINGNTLQLEVREL